MEKVSGKALKTLLCGRQRGIVKTYCSRNPPPTYTMSIFKLPISFCNELESIMANFWWHKSNGKSDIRWVSWDRTCHLKAQGGMRFTHLSSFNKSIVAKQSQRLITKPSLMAQVLKVKYYHSSFVLNASVGFNVPLFGKAYIGVLSW